jgi:hypothetical protein
MLHGLRDDNVLAEDDPAVPAFHRAGKEDWNLTLYPVERHPFQRPS